MFIDLEYIEMSKQQKNIQMMCSMKDGDLFYCPSHKVLVQGNSEQIIIIKEDVYMKQEQGLGIEELAEVKIWLPRQDQLQEIYFKHLMKVNKFNYDELFKDENKWYGIFMTTICHEFPHFCKYELFQKYNLKFNTVEKYWLNFIVFKMYNEVWDKIKYIEIQTK